MLPAWAGQQSLATISDPLGDDYGPGTLIYPQRSDFQTGNLDLHQMKISRDEDGFWFEAMFKNPIRDPGSGADADGIKTLANFARKGFYQFNLDVYIDSDRIKGSGNTFTLPGRQVKIDPAYAWEKAVILTPRPELMRQQLLDALAEQFPERASADIIATVDRFVFFPTQVRVRGKYIAFFAPAGFFSGGDGLDWAITALVTGAMASIPVDLSLLPSTKTPLERIQMGAMQPAAGLPKDTFGYSGAIASPVVDMLGASVERQKRQLAAKDNLTGASWGPHADIGAQAAASGTPIAEQKPDDSSKAIPVASFGNLFQTKTSAAPLPEKQAAEAKPLAGPSIANRLQALRQLFEQKLIDDAEYKQQKQRILNEL